MWPAAASGTAALQGNRPASAFMAQRGNLLPPSYISLQTWDGTQRVTGAFTQLIKIDRKNKSSSSPHIYAVATRTKMTRTSEVAVQTEKSPLHAAQNHTLITGDHQGDCTFQHAARREEWTEANTTMRGGGL